MGKILTDSEKREHLKELISDFRTAMLVTRTIDGGLRSRPLAIADDRTGAALSFATAIDSAKVHELEADDQVNVAMQGKQRFVSVTGVARIERDRALIDRLWSEAWKPWFPGGKGDPSLCILTVEPTEASYWDNSGGEGVKYLFEMAKAFVTGTKAGPGLDDAHAARLKL
jgi:general stress protein 26